MMKGRMLIGMLVLALLTAVTVGLGQAQGPGLEPGRTADPAGAADASQQQAGATIPYAGRLSDEAGQPVVEGAYDLSFALYAAETGGEPLWSEVQAGVVVRGGGFSVSLGGANPIPPAMLDGQALWLAVGVRGPGEAGFAALIPRQQVSAAAPTAGAACPHDHFGEWWSGDSGPAGNGLRVENTRTEGIGVTGVAHNGADATGVFGWTTQGVGVRGSSDSSTGVRGTSNSGVGVKGESVNGAGVFAHSDNGTSIYVDGAGTAGLYIQSSGTSAIYVESSGGSGVFVGAAAGNGMSISSAGLDGIHVYTAGDDGVHVEPAIGGMCYRCGSKEDDGFVVLNTGEVRSEVGYGTPARDFAVMMDVAGDKASYEPGDVLVASSTGEGSLERSSAPYSPAVVGIYSAAPGFVGGQPVSDQHTGGVPVAILGVVSCKVSAENGPIRPGDLLVTSATPGYAMRADRDSAQLGTILGKALGSLDSGTGLIQVLVTLQ
jgi:hypothetical protein